MTKDRLYIVVGRRPSDSGQDIYCRGPGAGIFNAGMEWVGSMRWDCAKRTPRAEAEAMAAAKAADLPTRRVEAVSW